MMKALSKISIIKLLYTFSYSNENSATYKNDKNQIEMYWFYIYPFVANFELG